MISEHQFATHYSSVWHSVAPLSDGFWSVENKRVDRYFLPLSAVASKGLRAVVNEAAFRAFCVIKASGNPFDDEDILGTLQLEFPGAIGYVSRFSNSPLIEFDDIDGECCTEALELTRRLLSFFSADTGIVLRPHFSGCGLLSACEGDVIAGSCLYEIKAGDRPFRILDLRQLLVYSALAYADAKLTFSHLGIVNPRTGVVWKRSLEEVCQSVSGLRRNDTLSTLVDQFSMASVSR